MAYLLHFPGAKATRECPSAELAPLADGWLLAKRLLSLGSWLNACIEAMADYYAGMILYEQLSRLSDAELHRRGLTRADLARHVLAACEHHSPKD
jgi:hypothetical protein